MDVASAEHQLPAGHFAADVVLRGQKYPGWHRVFDDGDGQAYPASQICGLDEFAGQ